MCLTVSDIKYFISVVSEGLFHWLHKFPSVFRRSNLCYQARFPSAYRPLSSLQAYLPQLLAYRYQESLKLTADRSWFGVQRHKSPPAVVLATVTETLSQIHNPQPTNTLAYKSTTASGLSCLPIAQTQLARLSIAKVYFE